MLNPFKPISKYQNKFGQSTIVVTSENDDDQVEIFTGEELLNSPLENIPCLVAPIFPSCGLAALGGSSDTGKSAFLRLFAITVVLGFETFLGFKLFLRYRSAIYVSSEDAKDAMICLLKKQNRGLNYDKQAYKNLRFIFDWGKDLIQTLEKQLKKQSVDAIIIDAFMDIFTGGVKDNDKIREFLNGYKRLAERYDCLIIFLHHTGKGTENKVPSKNNFLGGQSFEAKVRVAIEFRLDYANPRFRHFCIVKGNYIPHEYKDKSFVLEFDENMLFHNNGQRVPFHELTPAIPGSNNDGRTSDKLENDGKDEQIAKMLHDGHSYTAIQKQLGVSPNKISKIKQELEKTATTTTTIVETLSNSQVVIASSALSSAAGVGATKDEEEYLLWLVRLADKVLKEYQPRSGFNLVRAIAAAAEIPQKEAETVLISMVENKIISHSPDKDRYWLD